MHILLNNLSYQLLYHIEGDTNFLEVTINLLDVVINFLDTNF